MDEMIEKLVNETIKEISGFTWIDQSLILVAISGRLTEYSHTCLMNEYGLSEEDV